jgi:hypothetical protein
MGGKRGWGQKRAEWGKKEGRKKNGVRNVGKRKIDRRRLSLTVYGSGLSR